MWSRGESTVGAVDDAAMASAEGMESEDDVVDGVVDGAAPTKKTGKNRGHDRGKRKNGGVRQHENARAGRDEHVGE